MCVCLVLSLPRSLGGDESDPFAEDDGCLLLSYWCGIPMRANLRPYRACAYLRHVCACVRTIDATGGLWSCRDIEGLDTANKLVIIANAVLGCPAKLSDVQVEGITSISESDRQAAAANGDVIRLVATATPVAAAAVGPSPGSADGAGAGGDAGASCAAGSGTTPLQYTLQVGPKPVPKASFLGSCIGTDMGIIITTNTFEVQSFKTNETGVTPTSAAMLRDMVTIAKVNTRHATSSVDLTRVLKR